MKILPLVLASALVVPTLASAAAPVTRVGAPTAPIASLVVAPAGSDLVFVSGTTPDTPVTGDTQAQTVNVLTKISALLKAQGMTMGDIVMMRVFLGVDPKDGHADRPGMNAGFKQFFGTADQPNKPARTTIAVPDMQPGHFVEIDAQAVRPH
jgi:enamine deaminase RidA (YjgF/YER057c/UK114 family)